MANWPGHRPSGAAATTDSHQTRNTSNAQTPKSHSHSRSLSGGRALITAGELFYTTRPPDLGRGSARCRRFSIQAVVEVGHQPSVRGTRWRFIPHTRSSNASSGNRFAGSNILHPIGEGISSQIQIPPSPPHRPVLRVGCFVYHMFFEPERDPSVDQTPEHGSRARSSAHSEAVHGVHHKSEASIKAHGIDFCPIDESEPVENFFRNWKRIKSICNYRHITLTDQA